MEFIPVTVGKTARFLINHPSNQAVQFGTGLVLAGKRQSNKSKGELYEYYRNRNECV